MQIHLGQEKMLSILLSLVHVHQADTRMILHIAHARRNGYCNILIRTVGTDVVVLVIAALQQLGGEFRLLFGTGRHLYYISVSNIVDKIIGETWSKGLSIFHALTGCDSVGFCWKR